MLPPALHIHILKMSGKRKYREELSSDVKEFKIYAYNDDGSFKLDDKGERVVRRVVSVPSSESIKRQSLNVVNTRYKGKKRVASTRRGYSKVISRRRNLLGYRNKDLRSSMHFIIRLRYKGDDNRYPKNYIRQINGAVAVDGVKSFSYVGRRCFPTSLQQARSFSRELLNSGMWALDLCDGTYKVVFPTTSSVVVHENFNPVTTRVR